MKKTKKYYPNKWQVYSDAPSDKFDPIEFELFMNLRVFGWELPRQVECLIRTKNIETKKVKEYSYKRKDAAIKKFRKLVTEPDLEIVVCNHEIVQGLQAGGFFTNE